MHYANSVTIRHTTDAKTRLDQGHKIMSISNKLADELSTIFNRRAKIKMMHLANVGFRNHSLAEKEDCS
jgi:hypothetical protein